MTVREILSDADAALCLTCRFYDERPPFAGDLPDTYGRCTWSPDLSRLPAVTLLGLDLQRAAARQHTRMIPKRALVDRPDLWATCDTYAERAAGAADKDHAAEYYEHTKGQKP